MLQNCQLGKPFLPNQCPAPVRKAKTTKASCFSIFLKDLFFHFNTAPLLSVIIVSYNVKYFLEQCLWALQAALKETDAEIIVVDNASSDNSVAYLAAHFHNVKFIANKENLGYAHANNIGWQAAQGEWVLFLNPDTLVAEESITQCLSFVKETANAGACGIRMIDGAGVFLPESKRGLPTLAASFFKLTGFIKLFPTNKRIGAYYAGHLSAYKNNPVPILSGAFMMVKKTVLQQTGGFDEAFFMYGEDVDLSYRITQLGYSNYYIADSAIIHFKGESTRKDSKYVKMFYKAMKIFVKKHYNNKPAFLFFINLAIGAATVMALLGKWVKPKGMPVVKTNLNSLIVATPTEAEGIMRLLNNNNIIQRTIHRCNPDDDVTALLNVIPVDEVFFCAGTQGYKKIIATLQACCGRSNFKFYSVGSNSIVSSTSKNTSGEVIY
jgi:N-acetylglucosaminyl-diphospho-decaprenol L-rhamnosyltransferase